jgi:hypothetical protein
MSSLLSIATEAKTGQGFPATFVRSERPIRYEISHKWMGRGLRRHESDYEEDERHLTRRERKRKGKVTCLV